MKFLRNLTCTLCLLLLSFNLFASFKSAVIGIDGLTCSMCSNTVEKLLSQLSFISVIKMDLNENIAVIQFYENTPVNINQIASKVKDAGYSVRFLKAIFTFDHLKISNNSSFLLEGNNYNFINVSDVELNGETEITFVGKNFLSKKEFTTWKALIDENKKVNKASKGNYYITL